MKKIILELLTIYTRRELMELTGLPAYTITRAIQGRPVQTTKPVIDAIKLHQRRRGRIANMRDKSNGN